MLALITILGSAFGLQFIIAVIMMWLLKPISASCLMVGIIAVTSLFVSVTIWVLIVFSLDKEEDVNKLMNDASDYANSLK